MRLDPRTALHAAASSATRARGVLGVGVVATMLATGGLGGHANHASATDRPAAPRSHRAVPDAHTLGFPDCDRPAKRVARGTHRS